MKCYKGHEVKPLKSAAGWYMGTMTEDGPYCRITSNYYKTAAEAEKHLYDDYRYCMENDFCNNGYGCLNKYSLNPMPLE